MSDLLALRPTPKFLDQLAAPPALRTGNADSLAKDFFSQFKMIMGDVNDKQFQSEDMVRAFAAGDVTDVHDVALAINKAKFALDFTVRVRDKMLEAYRELSQMR